MSDIPSLADRIAASTVKAENASQIMHDVANGGPAVEVPTESGPVPTIQKWFAKLNDRTSGAVGQVAQALENLTPADIGAEPVQTAATQAEMEAGTEAAIRSMSPLLVKKAIAANASKVLVYTYESRGDLRSVAAKQDDQAIVDGLGLFVWKEGSDEPDDDESCFATATGRWLLECPHWDVVSLWQLPDDAVRDEHDEDEPLRFASSFASKVLSGTATCAITSVANTSSASFTGTVTGASVGDRVIATPPAELGATAAETGRLSYHAWVSAANTVTVMLTNGSAAAANTNAAILAAWPITVIKS